MLERRGPRKPGRVSNRMRGSSDTQWTRANSGKPDIAIAVVLENQGEGSDWAAPVFKGIVQSYYYGQPQTVPWFGPYDNLYTPTPYGYVTKTPWPKGRPTSTPKP